MSLSLPLLLLLLQSGHFSTGFIPKVFAYFLFCHPSYNSPVVNVRCLNLWSQIWISYIFLSVSPVCGDKFPPPNMQYHGSVCIKINCTLWPLVEKQKYSPISCDGVWLLFLLWFLLCSSYRLPLILHVYPCVRRENHSPLTPLCSSFSSSLLLNLQSV